MRTIYGIIIFTIIFVFIALVGSANANTALKGPNFDKIQLEVKELFKEVTGQSIRTQTVDIGIWDPYSSIVAYCRPGDGNYPTYITFNHFLLNKFNPEVQFQVVLHEYIHCEFRIGHLQIANHFMNDGGNPALTKAQTIEQFKKLKDFMFDFWNIKSEVVKPEVLEDQFLPFKITKAVDFALLNMIVPLQKPELFVDINDADIISYIKMNEGLKHKVYLDTRGNLTGGYGHKLSKKYYKVGDYIYMSQIDTWFRGDYNTARACAIRFLKNDYNHNELKVVTDMAFNMGCTDLYDFQLFRKHINNRDYKMAGYAIMYSTYYKQVKNRADRNIRLLNQ